MSIGVVYMMNIGCLGLPLAHGEIMGAHGAGSCAQRRMHLQTGKTSYIHHIHINLYLCRMYESYTVAYVKII